MVADLLDALWGGLQLTLRFGVLLLPLILQFALLLASGWALGRLVFGFSITVGSLLSLIGTPVHELLHTAASIIALCGVAVIKLLSDSAGVAFVQTKRSNFVQRILVGLAPLLGGAFVLWLTATYIVPGFRLPRVAEPQAGLNGEVALITIAWESVQYIWQSLVEALRNLPSLEWDNWRTYVGLYTALSMGMGIVPSSADWKYLLRGLPVALVLTWIAFCLVYYDGKGPGEFQALTESLLPHLQNLSSAVTYAFVLTVIGVVIFAPLVLVKRLLKR
jgi:hypothetical protein